MEAHENTLITTFEVKRYNYELAEKNMSEHFDKIIDEMAMRCIYKSDFNKIKERLRVMPECGSKILLFRKIILLQDKHVDITEEERKEYLK